MTSNFLCLTKRCPRSSVLNVCVSSAFIKALLPIFKNNDLFLPIYVLNINENSRNVIYIISRIIIEDCKKKYYQNFPENKITSDLRVSEKFIMALLPICVGTLTNSRNVMYYPKKYFICQDLQKNYQNFSVNLLLLFYVKLKYAKVTHYYYL